MVGGRKMWTAPYKGCNQLCYWPSVVIIIIDIFLLQFVQIAEKMSNVAACCLCWWTHWLGSIFGTRSYRCAVGRVGKFVQDIHGTRPWTHLTQDHIFWLKEKWSLGAKSTLSLNPRYFHKISMQVSFMSLTKTKSWTVSQCMISCYVVVADHKDKNLRPNPLSTIGLIELFLNFLGLGHWFYWVFL